MKIYFVCQDTPWGIDSGEFFTKESRAKAHFNNLYEKEKENPIDFHTKMYEKKIALSLSIVD